MNAASHSIEPIQLRPVRDTPYWMECIAARDCTTCGRDIWVGERCVISGPTIHCQICGTGVCCYEDDGAKLWTE
jgi:hypothetical protein